MAQPCLHVVLQIAVDGHLDVGPVVALAPVELAHDPAHGVDLDAFGPRLAAQLFLVFGLDSDLADLEARDAQHRLGVLVAGEVALGHRADVAHHMREVAVLRVKARQADLGGDPRKGRGVDRDSADRLPAHPIGDGDRQEGSRAAHLGQSAVELVLVQFDQRREFGDHILDVTGVFADDGDAVGRGVLGDDLALAVEDASAARRDQPHVDAVFLGQQAELVRLIDLHVVHAQPQHPGKAELRAAQQQGTARDAAPAVGAFLGGASHIGLPAWSKSPGAIRRTPNRPCDSRTTRG